MLDIIAKSRQKIQNEPKMTVKVTPKMTPKRQRMILKAKEMTLKKQRMTPRMVNMTPKTELLQMIYKSLTMTQ